MKLATSTGRVILTFALTATAAAEQPAGYAGFDDVHAMPFGRSDMTATVHEAAEGPRIYLIGGCDTDQVCFNPNTTMECYCSGLSSKTQYYSPDEDRYSITPADAPRPRYRHAAATLNGVIYLFGGRDVNDAVITEVDAYDVATNSWSTPCTWTGATSDLTAFTDGGTQIFVVGGWLPDYSAASSATLAFNPASCAFVTKATTPVAKGDIAAITVGGPGKELHFVVGGFYQDMCNGERTVASYNATADQWTVRSNLVLGRADMALGQIDDHIFAIAGESVNDECTRSIPVIDVERLDAGAGTVTGGGGSYSGAWAVEQSLPSTRFRFVGASHKAIYLFGGQRAWVDDLDGNGNGGFPVIGTTMVYRPNSTVDSGNGGNAAAAGPAAAVTGAVAVLALAASVLQF